MNQAQKPRISQSSIYLLIALATAAVSAFIYQLPYLQNPNTIDEDLRNLYWISRAQDSSLYPHDVLDPEVIDVKIGSFTFTILKLAPGYSTIFMVLGSIIPPILLSKLLIFPLLMIAVYYLFLLVESQLTSGAALGVALGFIGLDLASSTNISTNAGVQRSFSFPLMIGLVYFMTMKKPIPAAVVLFLSGVIYPPVFLLLAITSGLYYLLKLIHQRLDRLFISEITPFILSVFLVFVCLIPAFSNQVSNPTFALPMELVGRIRFTDMIMKDGFRYPFFTMFPILGAGGLFMTPVDFLNTGVLLVLVLITRLVLRKRFQKPPRIIYVLLLAGIIGFIISWLGILITHSMVFHLPSRLTQSMLPLVLFYMFATNAGALLMKLMNKLFSISKNSKKEPGTPSMQVEPPKFFWVTLGVVFAIIMSQYITGIPKDFYTPSSENLKLMNFIGSLPKEVTIAGDPCSLNNVPLYARRQILFSCEKPNPDPDIVVNWLRAYYSDQPSEIIQFCKQHEIKYLVVNLDSFQRQKISSGIYYFEPYNELLRSLVRQRSKFALEHLQSDKILFSQGSLRVIPCAEPAFQAGD
jgi:hypothetical protein